MNIKQVRPSKKRFQQGYINPGSCKKLLESQSREPIIYRSSYEKIFIQWLENNSKVKSWASECMAIPYVNKLDGESHHYYPDFFVIMENGDQVLIEIKPKNQTVPPKTQFDPNGYAWKEYIRNRSKWAAAMEFCQKNGLLFKILTEETISRL